MPAEEGVPWTFDEEDEKMSLTITLTSVLVGVAVTAATGSSVLGLSKLMDRFCKDETQEEEQEEYEPILTRFSNGDLLRKTLREHGIETELMENREILMESSYGKLRFYKEGGEDAYWVLPYDLKDPQKVLEDMEELDEEYMENVQTFTYNGLKERLKGRTDLELESEEVLEDNTILLTLTVN